MTNQTILFLRILNEDVKHSLAKVLTGHYRTRVWQTVLCMIPSANKFGPTKIYTETQIKKYFFLNKDFIIKISLKDVKHSLAKVLAGHFWTRVCTVHESICERTWPNKNFNFTQRHISNNTFSWFNEQSFLNFLIKDVRHSLAKVLAGHFRTRVCAVHDSWILLG